MSNFWKSILVMALLVGLGAAVSCTRDLSVSPTTPVSVTSNTATSTTTSTVTATPTQTSVFTSTVTNTPTITQTPQFSYTPTLSPTVTNTLTITMTQTVTSTQTMTPTVTNTATTAPTPWLYEGFNGVFPPGAPTSNGNCYAADNPAPQWFLDEYFNCCSGSITAGQSTVEAYPSGETESEACTLTFAGPSGNTGWGICSIGGAGCGGPISVYSGLTTSSSYITYWLYPVTADGQNLTFESGILTSASASYNVYETAANSNTVSMFSIPSGQWSPVTMTLNTNWYTIFGDTGAASTLPANSTTWEVTYINTIVIGPASFTGGGTISATNESVDDVYCADYEFWP